MSALMHHKPNDPKQPDRPSPQPRRGDDDDYDDGDIATPKRDRDDEQREE